MSMLNEPDFEVIDLRTGLPGMRVPGDKAARRRRSLGGVVLALLLLCVLALPFFSVPGFSERVGQALHLPVPSPTPTIPAGGNVVYFEHGLPWGALLLDGKRVTKVDTEQPYTGLEMRYTSLRIPRGRHQLTYTATPFPTLRCWISVPAARGDSCPLDIAPSQRDVRPPFPAARVLNLGGDPTHLMSPLESSLEAAVARNVATLTASTTLMPGEIFAGTDGAERVASVRMTATISFVMNTDPGNSYVIPGSNLRGCATICSYLPASYISDPEAQWLVVAHVLPVWTYTRDDGASFRGSAAPKDVAPDNIVLLAVRWDGGWQVTAADAQAGSPLCFTALTMVSLLHLAGAPLSSLEMVSAPTAAAGCLISGAAPDASGAPRIPFIVMYRFGLLFAVDNAARRLLPGLPAADAYLRVLAREWRG